MTDVVQNPDTTPTITHEPSRTGLSGDALRRGVVDHLRYSIGRPAAALKSEHYYRALALAVRDRMQDNRVASTPTSLDTEVFRPLVDNLRYDDPFLVLADYAAYVSCQQQVSAAWQDTAAWTRMSILNTARSGKFSSDRAITEYCDDIWNVWPVTVTR